MPVRRLAALAAVLALAVIGAAGCDSYPSACEAGELATTDLTIGAGDEATLNDSVRVDYTGTLENGDVFSDQDNQRVSLPSARPLGFRDGVAGMREGGLRRIVLPPNFAFGASGIEGLVPPCETVAFEVRLLEVLGPDD